MYVEYVMVIILQIQVFVIVQAFQMEDLIMMNVEYVIMTLKMIAYKIVLGFGVEKQ